MQAHSGSTITGGFCLKTDFFFIHKLKKKKKKLVGFYLRKHNVAYNFKIVLVLIIIQFER